jgi:hypothetical protein
METGAKINTREKDPAAVALGRRGGLYIGQRRTPEGDKQHAVRHCGDGGRITYWKKHHHSQSCRVAKRFYLLAHALIKKCMDAPPPPEWL